MRPTYNLDDCKSIEEVVELINHGGDRIFDWYDQGERFAARYAVDASDDFLDLGTVAFHLDYLREHGANFSYSQAFNHARELLHIAAMHGECMELKA